ncbi:MAG: C10 family peptidase [Bacteroidales bacterium]|nr:C10 family peptidase [Bacteroidales bacterium]
MKSGYWFLAAAALFILSFNSSAQIVEPDNARKIAGITFSELCKGGDAGTITGDSVIYDSLNQPLIYIFNESKGGFIIISADKRSFPLLGWSESGHSDPGFSKMPPALKEMIYNWADQINFIRKNDLSPTPAAAEMWKKMESGEFAGLSGSKDVVPLLLTKWNQGCGYNSLCPVDASGSCGHAYTGCVATAMAQVIRYNEHPITGIGSKCYTSGWYGELCAVFSDGIYDYAAMSNASGNTPVAKLMYHCGVSVSMNYGPSSSGAYSGAVATAMRTYFDYTNGLILSKGSYPEEGWANILKSELEHNRPLYYSGSGTSGHAFVLDGYEATSHFHVNWGWGGSYNGYFYLTALNPGSMDFTSGQQAIAGMIPTAEFTGLDFSSAVSLGCKTPVSGNLSTGTNYVNYYKNIYPAAIGKELVYTFTTTLPGRIRIKITDQSEPVYTFLLNYANKDSLVNYGSNGLTVDNTSPGTYYVVVESQNYSEPSFTIEVICPTMDADLDISSASVIPQFIQSLQANVSFSSTVKNIGKTASASAVMEYYLSPDNIFDYGSDTLLGSQVIPSLDPGNKAFLHSNITMPDNLNPGGRFIIFVADRENVIPETDDENTYYYGVTVPEPGKIDCSSSVSLSDADWHYGNTMSDGINKIEEYSMAWEMTGPEVVHTFTPSFNGMVEISFVDKSPGMLYAMIMPVCNENTVERSLRIYNITDTLISEEFYVVAGVQYYLVVDGQNEASGDYGLKIELPEECPSIKVEHWGSLDHCDGDSWPGFYTFWGHDNYQWYKDDISIPGATSSSYTTSSPGTYLVKIAENGCTGSSVPVVVRSDPRPDTARIVSLDVTTFCHGSSVTLKLDNSVSYPLHWAKDDVLISGAEGSNYSAFETGSYSLYTVNGACRVKSENSISVTLLDPPVDIGDSIPVPSDKIRFYCPFNTGSNTLGGGEKFSMIGWDYQPVDDRFGNFWKARYLMGDDEKLYWSDYDTIPEDFTLALWIRTTTNSGGVVAGFFNNTYGPTKMEAILYMSDNGKLHFRLSNGGTPADISSSASYNDGSWHYVMIQHDGAMTLEVDDGVEKITSAGPFTKENFQGYWIFGGPDLPSGVTPVPSSKFYRGSIDDILCLDEANEYTTPYMVRRPKLKVSLTDAPPSCVPASILLGMPFSQKGIEYKVWDDTRSLWAPVTAVGDGGDIQFGGAEVVLGTNEFQVVAKNPVTGCESVLDTIIIVQPLSVCTLMPDNLTDTELKIYPVPAKEILYFESGCLVEEIRIFDPEGKLVYMSAPCSSSFNINVQGFARSAYLYCLKCAGNKILSGKIIIL